jgi:hypothetical protein
MIKRTERGWSGHFILADKCLFRRNTLLESKEEKIVVSTVGAYQIDGVIAPLGYNRYYETMAFRAVRKGPYLDADTYKPIPFTSNWAINADSVEDLPDYIDNLANEQHEHVVEEISRRLLDRQKKRTQ